MSEPESPAELYKAIRATPEWQIRQRLLSFNSTLYIFDTNYKDLMKLVQPHIDEMIPAATRPENVALRTAFRMEIIRRLHNFVAAAQTLIDHSTRIVRKLYANDEFPEYKAKVNETFAADPLSYFVRGLRQYCQHYQSPDISFCDTWERREDSMFAISNVIYIPREKLLRFEWHSQAKKYITSQGTDKIDIIDPLTQYHQKVIQFYAWFQQQSQRLNADAMDKLASKERELARIWTPNAAEISTPASGQ
jgi:hypothetical protein